MSILSILFRMLFMLAFYFLPDLFIRSGIKTAFPKKSKKALRIYWIFNIIILLIAFSGLILNRNLENEFIRINLYMFGIFVAFLFTKILVAAFLFGEDIFRVPISIYKRWIKKEKPEEGEKSLISRRKFLSRSVLVFAALPFGGFIYGMVKGRYNFTIHKETLFFNDLPEAFDGITITQLSDLHIGSWDHFAKNQMEYAVQQVNMLQSDIICFTGDIVNSRSDEMNGWFDVFKKMEAPLAKISILGNHDYGDYVNWETEEDKKQNLDEVKNIHPQIGFELLLNEKKTIERNGQFLHFAGIENWGSGDFPKLGDLNKAAEGLTDKDFIILLSHDPTFWETHAIPHSSKPNITLSGHTHGFQMGIEIPGFRFSPAQFIYKQWAGLYQKGTQYIYVNRGLGTVGYPGRLGIWPEITQLTLRRKI
ncbi:MAG: metallophosphoesterase [Bacteroidetes bacterium]|nr:metallophosphoesterase [Bacteroidota bacterium]